MSHPGQGVDGLSLGPWGFPPGKRDGGEENCALRTHNVLGGSPDLCAPKSSLPELEVLAWLFMLTLSHRKVDIYLHKDPEGQGWEPQIPRSFLGPLLLLEPRATWRAEFAEHLQAGIFARLVTRHI